MSNKSGAGYDQSSAQAEGSVVRGPERIPQAEGSVVRDLKPSPVRAEEADLSSYRLGAVIRRSPAATVYRTEFRAKDGTELPAVIKVRELDAAGAAAAVRQWSGAMKLEHPHLLRLYAAGSSAIDHATAAWVVMERAEESLAGVLTERALSEDEVGEMLVPAVSALAYLHRNGYAHGAIQPSNVLACGDQLKMSCDNALRVSEGGVPAEDIRALGALIAEALTERGPHGVVRHPSGRFSEIVRHCSDPNPAKRWTAEQIGARLHEKETETVSEAAAVAESQAASSRATRSRGFPMWIFAGLAAVVLAVMLAAVLRTGNNKPASAAPVAAPPVASAVPDVASSAPPPLIEPAPAAAPAPPIVKPKPFPEAPHSKARKADGWYVIVAAYGSHDAAEKRMDTLARRWPGFQLRVSEHSAERAPWLVTLGENLSEDEAESLRARAVHAGVARDAYIKRMR